MKRILLAWSFLILGMAAAQAQSNSFVTIAAEPSVYAWWLRAQFRPFELQVRGVPIGKINASWCKATELRKDLFPADVVPDIEQSYVSFSIDGDFDGSRIRQTALVGVYETCSGKRGSFLLVLAHPPGKPPQVRFVNEFTALQFGMLGTQGGATIRVFHCLECDHVSSFTWDRAKKRFVRLKGMDE